MGGGAAAAACAPSPLLALLAFAAPPSPAHHHHLPEQGLNADPVLKPRPLKLPDRWQWSKGTDPGEYGGPPLHSRVRRMWGGDERTDPLTSTDDYIWNKNWQSYLDSVPSSNPPQKEPEVGFLSLNRSISLNSIDVDLSEELMTPTKSILELQVQAAREGLLTDESIKEHKPRYRMAPTRRERQQWARAGKVETGAIALLTQESGAERKDPLIAVAQSNEQYNQLKTDLQFFTLAVGGVGTITAYVSYSAEIAASYGVGLIGSLVYIRMLGNSVDSFGKQVGLQSLRGAVGQPRLLVPVVLVMIYNRWNEFLVSEYGFIHLQLIPILIGFFTYKAATVVEVFKDLFPIVKGKNENI
eukprot:c12888_g1_i1 orf=115-1182(+)